MKARIIKKLSKKLVNAAPKLFSDAWVGDDLVDEAWDQGSRVSNCLYVGGGVDYWGEGQDAYTTLEWMQNNWYWVGDFPMFEIDHKYYGFPDTGNFKPTSRNLLKLAAKSG